MESALKGTRRFWSLAATAAVLLALLAQPAQADNYWVGPNPNTLWTTANNWSSAGEPVTGDEVFLISATNKSAIYNTTLSPALAWLYVDASGGATFTLTQTANTLIADQENIGVSGKGQVVQSGGTNTIIYYGSLQLGFNSGSSGTYTLSGGGSLSAFEQDIGTNGSGLFTQAGGNNTVGEFLFVGQNPGGVGTYILSGGQLQAVNEFIGHLGTGTFIQQRNGTNIVHALVLGTASSSGNGTYTMQGGNLQASAVSVGEGGKGTFNQKRRHHQHKRPSLPG